MTHPIQRPIHTDALPEPRSCTQTHLRPEPQSIQDTGTGIPAMWINPKAPPAPPILVQPDTPAIMSRPIQNHGPDAQTDNGNSQIPCRLVILTSWSILKRLLRCGRRSN